MKIITWNVNGIRAVERKKALRPFIENENPDILFINETKCQPEQAEPIQAAYPQYRQYYHSAEKKGYSSVSVWVKNEIEHSVQTGMPGWNDSEGRIIRLDVGDTIFIGGYFPNGGKSPEAWEEKLLFYDHFLGYINDLRTAGKNVFWGGDINCAHNEIDIARAKQNEGKVGFHPKERAWMDLVIQQKWVDIYRTKNPESVVYSWWHMLTRARLKNVGWRIDYWLCDEKSLPQIDQILYLTEVQGSDHCPVLIQVTL